MNNAKIDQSVIDAANSDIVNVISRFVQLKKVGSEYQACCPFHQERTPSFKVVPKKGMFFCHGCSAGGDAVKFVREYEGLSFPAAVERIIGNLPSPEHAIDYRKETAKREEWLAIERPAPEAGVPLFKHWRLGEPAKVWEYKAADGHILGYVARFNTANDDGSAGKETLPLCWAVNTKTGACEWRWQAFAIKRPLYGLDKLAARKDRPVLVVEGEKTADAAQEIFKGHVTITWPGGCSAVGMADWSALEGRDVTFWPDWDAKCYKEGPKAGELKPLHEQPGIKAMYQAAVLCAEHSPTRMRVIPPEDGFPDGWDLADPAPVEGFDPVQYARANVTSALEWFASLTSQEAEAKAPVPENDNPIPSQTGNGFGQPIDIFGVQLPPQMPIELLPECLQEFVLDQAELAGCDHAIVGMTALVSAASCIHDGIRLQPKRRDTTWKESARLWVAFVGDPSTKKSPGISKPTGAIKSIEAKMHEKYNSAMAVFNAEMERFKEQKKSKKDSAAAGEPPVQPIRERLMVEDITIEALSEVLKDNSRGVLCLQDELTGWFAGMDAYKGNSKGASRDRAHWLEAYNGGYRAIDRVTRGSISIPNWSACMIGGIQPDMMKRIANSMGNDGLLQRFMVIVARSASRGEDREHNEQASVNWMRLLRHLVAMTPSPDVVTMEEAAHQARERISDLAMRMVKAFDHPHMVAWLGKWDGLFARLTLLYHVIECASDEVFPSTVQVSGQTAEKVEKLMCGVLLPHAIHFYTEIMDAHSKQENMRHVARMILARGLHRVTKRDLTLYWKASRALNDWELRETMTSLCNVDWLTPSLLTMDIDGRPTAWDVNPAVHETFAVYADIEKRRRQEAADTLREIKAVYQSE